MNGNRLEGKVAIVTGAASGIGEATARLFAAEGAKVVCADINTERGKEVVFAIKGDGGEATFIETDVSREADVKAMVSAAVDTYGGLDVMFNNAGINFVGNVIEQSVDDWNHILAVNLTGVFLGMKHAIPVMLERGGGSVINTASAFAHVGSARHSGYPASKGGVLMLTISTAAAFAAQNVRVNSISPGHIETPMLTRTRNIEEVRKAMAKRIPQGRMGTPEEVANVVLFLASDEASHVTGTTMHVDGGYVHIGT